MQIKNIFNSLHWCSLTTQQKYVLSLFFFFLILLLVIYIGKFLDNTSVQFSSVTQSCPTLCDPRNRSMLGLPIHHQLLEFTQTHVHWVGDAIQPCHPLLLLPSIFPSIRVFSKESVLRISGQSIGVSASASVLPMNMQGWFPLGWSGWISLQSKGLSRVLQPVNHKSNLPLTRVNCKYNS